MSKPRKHHYCPKSYLASFTSEKRDNGTLWEIDKSKREIRKSSPANSAHERDFYFVEVEQGKDPYFLETEFSKIEGGAKHAIQHILDTRTLPSEESYAYLINFIGLQAARVPRRMEMLKDFNEQVIRMTAKMVTERKEDFDVDQWNLSPVEKARAKRLSYEEFRKFILEDRYNVEIDSGHLLTGMLQLASTITELLAHRNWSILISDVSSSFVTSDNPVGLNWIKPVSGPYSPGFGLGNTWVTIPLSDKVALMGSFEQFPAIIEMTEDMVATINNFSIQHATRFIYSSAQDFKWYATDRGVSNCAELFDTLKS